MGIKGDEPRSDKYEQAMCVPGLDISTPIRNFECRAWRLYHRQWIVIRDSFRRLILPGFFGSGSTVADILVAVRSYTKGGFSTLRGPQGREHVEPVYGTSSSGVPSDTRRRRFLGPIKVGWG